MRTFRLNKWITLIPAALLPTALSIEGCGSSTSTSTQVTGVGMLGPISTATVKMYPIKAADGTLDTTQLLGSATTDSSGNYSISLSAVPSGPVGIQLTGGSYKDESTSATVNVGTNTFTAVLPSVTAGQTAQATLGPITNMAYLRFKTQMASGVPSGSTMAQLATNANYAAGQAFGITDPLGTIPVSPFGSSIPNNQTGQYTLALAAMSSKANSIGGGADAIALANAYAQAFQSAGSLSNLSQVTVNNAAGNPIPITPPPLSALTTAMQNLATAPLPGMPTPPSGFTMPTFNPAPPAVAPAGFVPGTPPSTAGLAPVTNGTAASCSGVTVLFSVTIQDGSNNVLQCTDFIGTSFATLKQNPPGCNAPACNFSLSACSTSGQIGSCRQGGSGNPADQIVHYYASFGPTAPPCPTPCK